MIHLFFELGLVKIQPDYFVNFFFFFLSYKSTEQSSMLGCQPLWTHWVGGSSTWRLCSLKTAGEQKIMFLLPEMPDTSKNSWRSVCCHVL